MEPPSDDPVAFTAREQQVLELLVRGLSNGGIAAALFLSPNTVLGYRKTLFAKLGVHTKLEAVVQGARRGLIDLPGVTSDGRAGGGEASGPEG